MSAGYAGADNELDLELLMQLLMQQRAAPAQPVPTAGDPGAAPLPLPGWAYESGPATGPWTVPPPGVMGSGLGGQLTANPIERLMGDFMQMRQDEPEGVGTPVRQTDRGYTNKPVPKSLSTTTRPKQPARPNYDRMADLAAGAGRAGYQAPTRNSRRDERRGSSRRGGQLGNPGLALLAMLAAAKEPPETRDRSIGKVIGAILNRR